MISNTPTSHYSKISNNRAWASTAWCDITQERFFFCRESRDFTHIFCGAYHRNKRNPLIIFEIFFLQQKRAAERLARYIFLWSLSSPRFFFWTFVRAVCHKSAHTKERRDEKEEITIGLSVELRIYDDFCGSQSSLLFDFVASYHTSAARRLWHFANYSLFGDKRRDPVGEVEYHVLISSNGCYRRIPTRPSSTVVFLSNIKWNFNYTASVWDERDNREISRLISCLEVLKSDFTQKLLLCWCEKCFHVWVQEFICISCPYCWHFTRRARRVSGWWEHWKVRQIGELKKLLIDEASKGSK